MTKLFSGKREIFLEVAERYERYIRAGVLTEGEKLPSVRTAADALGVNPNTVQKAYCHLEEKGLVYSLPKKGVFVAPLSQKKGDGKTETARQMLCELKAMGLTKKEIQSALEEVYGND